MRRLFPIVAALLALLVSGCAALQPAAAIVNGEKISEESLQEEVDRVRDDPNFQELLRQQGDRVRGIARRQVLTRFIRETLLDQEARRREIQATEAQIREFVDNLREEVGGPERFEELLEQANLTPDRVRELARRQILQEQLERQLTADLDVGDTEVQQWYEQNAAQYTEYQLRKIVVQTQDEAAEIAELLDDGADFAALARERSSDESASSGGDIGYVGPQVLGTLAAQIDAAEEGSTVGPVRGAEGFELYQVLGRRARALDQVRSEIVDQMLATERRAAFDRWIEQALRGADITVNPKYGTFDAQSLSVVGSDDRLAE